MKKTLTAFTLGLALLAAPVLALADHGGKHRVVIQVSDNDPAKWNLALNNAKNIQQALGKNNVDIEIVAFGPGINMLKMDSAVGSRLADEARDGVEIAACANTMKALKLKPEDMHPAATIVPAGVVEIMKREDEGWAYIKP